MDETVVKQCNLIRQPVLCFLGADYKITTSHINDRFVFFSLVALSLVPPVVMVSSATTVLREDHHPTLNWISQIVS